MQIESVSPRQQPLRCPYCHDELTRGGVSCGACQATHHTVCLYEQPSCATCGADMAALVERAALPVTQRRSNHTVATWIAGLVVLALLLLIGTRKPFVSDGPDPTHVAPVELPDSPGGSVSDSILRLSSPALTVRARALTDLRQLGPDAKPAIPALVELLLDPSPELRERALDTLLGIGGGLEAAEPRLLELLTEREPGVRAAALSLLTQLDAQRRPAALKALAKTIADSDPKGLALVLKSRDEIASALALRELTRRGAAAKPAAPTLQALLADPHEATARRAFLALTAIQGAEAVAIRTIGAGSDRLKLVAVGALRGSHDPLALRALTQALGDKDLRVARAAFAALERHPSPVLTPMLMDALEESKSRAQASSLLAQRGSAIVPALLEALSQRPALRPGAIATLSKLEPHVLQAYAASAAPVLATSLAQPGQETQQFAVRALLTLGSRAHPALEILIANLEHTNAVTRMLSVRVLARLGDRALEPIKRATTDRDPRVVSAAEKAMAQHQRRIQEENRRRLELRPREPSGDSGD